jgi:quercetin dioxygenase-like cupin family protein
MLSRGAKNQAREDCMRKVIVFALAVGTAAAVAAVAYSQPAPPADNVKVYYETPLEGDASKIVRLQSVTIPAGGGNNFHRHNGDQWAAIQEGEVTLTIKGQPPRVLKVGDSVHLPRGTVHRNQNLSDKPARSIELNIMDKGQPMTVAVSEWPADARARSSAAAAPPERAGRAAICDRRSPRKLLRGGRGQLGKAHAGSTTTAVP